MDRQPPNNGRSGKPPAFPFYAADWLSDLHVRRMAPAQRGLYIDLLALCWREGFVPDDPTGLGRALGYSAEEMAVAWPGVRARFRRRRRGGGLVNPRLERERSIAFTMREKRVEAAKIGGRMSAQKRLLPTIGSTDRAPPVNLASASASALASVSELDLPGDLELSLKLHPLVAGATSPEGRDGSRGRRRKRRVIEYTPGFVAAYQAYPIKIAKEEAFQEWIELVPAPVVDQVVGGILAWSASKKWQEEPDKIPYFKKFLHRRQWEQRPPGVVGENWQAAFNAKGEELKG